MERERERLSRTHTHTQHTHTHNTHTHTHTLALATKLLMKLNLLVVAGLLVLGTVGATASSAAHSLCRGEALGCTEDLTAVCKAASLQHLDQGAFHRICTTSEQHTSEQHTGEQIQQPNQPRSPQWRRSVADETRRNASSDGHGNAANWWDVSQLNSAIECTLSKAIEGRCPNDHALDPEHNRTLLLIVDTTERKNFDRPPDSPGQLAKLAEAVSPRTLIIAGESTGFTVIRWILQQGGWPHVHSLSVEGMIGTLLGMETFSSLPSLTRLRIADSIVIELFVNSAEQAAAAAVSSRLRSLTITASHVRVVHAAFFHNMTQLSTLDLSNNQLSSLDFLQGLGRLETLSLSNNHLRRITAHVLGNTPTLRLLDLSSNDIQRFDSGTFTHVPALEEVNLGDNFMPRLPEELLRPLPSLKSFIVRGGLLTSLPAGIFSTCHGLTSVVLSHNALRSLPDGVFEGLNRLERLALSQNRLPTISSAWFGQGAVYHKLVRFMAIENRVTSIPSNLLSLMPNVNNIGLQKNSLTRLPDDFVFGTATNLHVLDLSGNAISSLQPNAFHRFTALRHLSLSGNKLSRLSLPTLPTLLTLRLVDNRLTALPDLRAFDSLYELYLTNHHVHTLDLALLPQHGNIRRMELAMAPALARGAAGPGAIVYTSQHTQGQRARAADGSSSSSSSIRGGAEQGVQTNKLAGIDGSAVATAAASLFGGIRALDVRNMVAHELLLGLHRAGYNLTYLAAGWPDMTEDVVSQAVLCNLLDTNRETTIRLTNTGYEALQLCKDRVLDVVYLQSNSRLHTVEIFSPVQQLNVSQCEQLLHLSLPATDILDISETRVAASHGLCRDWGRRVLAARAWLNEGVREDDALQTFLSRCLVLSEVEVLDLSMNTWLNDPALVEVATGGVSAISEVKLFTEDFVHQRQRNSVPILQLTGTGIECQLLPQNVRTRRRDSLNEHRMHFGFAFGCSCASGYRSSGGTCEPESVNVPVVVVGTVAGVLVLQLIVFVIVRSRRRQQRLRADFALKQKLLCEKDAEVLALKRGWEIDFDELNLRRHVCTGAFGEVWEGFWDTLHVAVKVVKQDVIQFDDELRQEFEVEVEFLQRTRHANLVRFFGAGKSPTGAPFLVLEYMALGSLTELLQRDLQVVLDAHVQQTREERSLAPSSGGGGGGGGGGGKMTVWELKKRLAADVACGMAFIHSLNQQHRDLKSGNVLVSRALRGKITDFGSIRQRLQWHGRGSTNKSSASSFGASNGGGGYGSGEDDDDDDMFELPDIRYSWANGNKTMHLSMTAGVGTPMYMAPEALYGRSYDQKADVFSFGVLLWEIATQRRPDIIQQEYGDRFDGPLFPTIKEILSKGKRLQFPDGLFLCC